MRGRGVYMAAAALLVVARKGACGYQRLGGVPAVRAASVVLAAGGRRASRRARHDRTLDFTRVRVPQVPKASKAPGARKTPPALCELLDAHGCGDASAGGVARAVEAAAAAGALDARGLAAAVNELAKDGGSAAAAAAAVAAHGDVLASAPRELGSCAHALCRAGACATVRALCARLFGAGAPAPRGGDGGAAAPARAYSPLVATILADGGGDAARDARAWVEAEVRAAAPGAAGAAREAAPPRPFAAALKAARSAKALDVAFDILAAADAAGLDDADDAEFFETFAQCAARGVDFVKGAVAMEGLPADGSPEVCFVGRSNVGKSSLVNLLTNRRAAAFTSKKPGKTRELNVFNVNARRGAWKPTGSFALVDVPGAGFARAPGEARGAWAALLDEYLAQRPTLKVAFHLVDARVGAQPVDLDLFAVFDRARAARADAGLPPLKTVLVLTKADKKAAAVGRDAVRDLRRALAGVSGDDVADAAPVVATSAVAKRGRGGLWRELRPVVLGGDPPGAPH